MTAIRDQLREASFLEGATESALHHLGKLVTTRIFEPDELLFVEGAQRSFLAILFSGAVAIEKNLNGRPVRLATLGPGEAIGEGLLLDDSTHGTSARAIVRTEGGVLDAAQVKELLKDAPAVYAALVARAARAISRRLAATDATLVGHGRTMGFGGGRTRTEHDLLGEREIPFDAMYGVQTLRALENFPITGVALREFPSLVEALASVKEAAAMANQELGLLDAGVAGCIVQACQEIRAGRHHEHFLVDMIQGGAGTSTNMNANEVIANRALELSGHERGDYHFAHPNNHVNLSQSTNDVYPTAVKLALHDSIESLRIAMASLAAAFLAKGEEFSPHIKMGRTQLQDAVPMTLGQEFTAFGHTILEDVERLAEAQALIREINMGATAIGTGINAPAGYADTVCTHLSRITGLTLITAPDLVEATADTGSFVQLSGVLKRCAVKLSKICNDLRLLSSGPRAGFGEINLPAMQPGSSIMPGKVNPVIPEVVNQVCFDVIGGDMTVTMAAEAGQLQLNVFEPVIAYRLLRSADTMRAACGVLQTRCVEGITANVARMRQFVEHSIGIVTALVPVLGYEASTEIAKLALESGRGVYELVLERKLLTREELDRLLNPDAMTAPRTVTR
ncbi:MAG: aspartate ammonia-lyase [Gemmatimonadetes bacterium]|nr:aspartate ammonia-lyase [Gemmatimonadota bacterium]